MRATWTSWPSSRAVPRANLSNPGGLNIFPDCPVFSQYQGLLEEIEV
jgi:hypothetical protein